MGFTYRIYGESYRMTDESNLQCISANIRNNFNIGLPIHVGLPYCAILEFELHLLRYCNPSISYQRSPKPDQLRNDDYWRYVKGLLASSRRRILGPVILLARTENKNVISTCQIVVAGSSMDYWSKPH